MVEDVARVINRETGNIPPIPKVDDKATDAELQTESSAVKVADM